MKRGTLGTVFNDDKSSRVPRVKSCSKDNQSSSAVIFAWPACEDGSIFFH